MAFWLCENIRFAARPATLCLLIKLLLFAPLIRFALIKIIPSDFFAYDLSGSRLPAMSSKQQVMVQPINQIFRLLQNKTPCQIMLFEQTHIRLEGTIIGFDEYMNLVLDEASELDTKKKSTKPLGRILLKGDNIAVLMNAPEK